MKKVDVIARVVESINHQVVRRVPGLEKGKPVVREIPVSSLDELLSRSKSLVLRAYSASADDDGYASTTPGNGSPGGGKGGGRLMKIEGDLVPTTSTETAALLGVRDGGDPLQRLGSRALAQLQVMAAAVKELEHIVSDADRLQATGRVPEARMCAVATMLGLPWADEWDVRASTGARLTDFAGQLAVPLPEKQLVCKHVYWFVYNHKRLPDQAELLEYLAKKGRR